MDADRNYNDKKNYLNSSRNSNIDEDVSRNVAHVLWNPEEAEPTDEPVEADGDGAHTQFWRSEQIYERRMLFLFMIVVNYNLLWRCCYSFCWSTVSEINRRKKLVYF